LLGMLARERLRDLFAAPQGHTGRRLVSQDAKAPLRPPAPRTQYAHEPEIPRVDPESGSTLKALIEIFSQTAGSTCEFWVNPVNFTLGLAQILGRLPVSNRDSVPSIQRWWWFRDVSGRFRVGGQYQALSHRHMSGLPLASTPPGAATLGFGRVVASKTEAPNLLANLV
jgi:hypothetical protein